MKRKNYKKFDKPDFFKLIKLKIKIKRQIHDDHKLLIYLIQFQIL